VFFLRGMGFMESLRQRASVVLAAVHAWIPFGFLAYLSGVFFLDGSKQKTIFYLLTALPALALLTRIKDLSRAEPWTMASLLMFFAFFSISALWSGGDDSVSDGLRFSLYIICLGLAAEACVRRFSVDFVASFVVVVGGFAVVVYWIAIALGDVSIDRLLTERFTLRAMVGWGGSNPITTAVIFGLPVLAAWWLMARRRWQLQLVLVALMALCLGLMFFTKSRGPIAALCLTLLLLSLIRRNRTDIVLVSVGGFLAASTLLFSSLGSVVAERAAAPNYRLDIWLQVLAEFRESWLLGAGFGNEARFLIANGQVVTHSHSFLFEVFRQGGIVGGGLFLLMLGLLLRRAFSQSGLFFLLWLIYGAICLLTNGRMVLSRPGVEWFAFWVPLLLLYFSTLVAAERKFASEPRS
jgi:O-antigen ligase